MSNSPKNLPTIIAGPIVRHISKDSISLWMVSTVELKKSASLIPKIYTENRSEIELHKKSIEHTQIQVGERCFIHNLVVLKENLFDESTLYYYDAHITLENQSHECLSVLLKDQLYANEPYFSVKYSKHLTRVLHGSCRKAHFKGADALPQLDQQIKQSIEKKDLKVRPDLMLFTGDQVYIDDVAGPMLYAIHQTIDILGLFHEKFEGSTITRSEELSSHEHCYYLREQLLPKTEDNEDLTKAFFKGKKKPVFTSVNASNHLIALNEMLALYLLSWSSRLWPSISIDKEDLAEEFKERYAFEKDSICNFKTGLEAVERALAHMPIYMIFDDHDVTDDWNLTRAWEEQVYGNPFSKRIIGNALCAYFLCQGLGNPKSTWADLIEPALECFDNDFSNKQDAFIDTLFEFDQWQYRLDTIPPIQVLDTRTQRWRSESNKNKPSGLMDWEALCELQQQIIGQQSVIMVSAAPVYGVKFIETIQRIFITFGGALMVDAENWMAHRGTASVMLNIFRHIKTPPNFIILSGDVHYSFVYDVSLRFRRNSPKITQFTCSGIHNEFPDKLIRWFERLNRVLYSYKSPLNWLTKRRNMSIKERKADFEDPSSHSNIGPDKEIVNGTALGLLELDGKGKELACKLILANGTMVTFTPDN